MLDLTFNLHAPKLHEQLTQAIDYLKQADTGECKGYITYRQEGSSSTLLRYLKTFFFIFYLNKINICSYEEFHPFLFKQFESKPFIELPTFDRVDLIIFFLNYLFFFIRQLMNFFLNLKHKD
jgi:hypothetical protein